jgi:hypothetical protein
MASVNAGPARVVAAVHAGGDLVPVGDRRLVVPDIAQIVNIALLLFMFVSPIGFTIDSVPAACARSST